VLEDSNPVTFSLVVYFLDEGIFLVQHGEHVGKANYEDQKYHREGDNSNEALL